MRPGICVALAPQKCPPQGYQDVPLGEPTLLLIPETPETDLQGTCLARALKPPLLPCFGGGGRSTCCGCCSCCCCGCLCYSCSSCCISNLSLSPRLSPSLSPSIPVCMRWPVSLHIQYFQISLRFLLPLANQCNVANSCGQSAPDCSDWPAFAIK